jgi:hypothetical protein
MKYILSITIVIVLLVVQYFLSNRKSPLFGGILPLLVIPFSAWVIKSHSLSINFDTLFPFFGLLIILSSIWAEGREHQKKKQKRELGKMKARDIDK